MAKRRYVKSTAKTTWQQRNKAKPPQTRDEMADERTTKAMKVSGGVHKGSPDSLMNTLGYINHNCRREPFAGGFFQYCPEDIRKDPEKYEKYKKYVIEQKGWWNDEMRQEARGYYK